MKTLICTSCERPVAPDLSDMIDKADSLISELCKDCRVELWAKETLEFIDGV